MTLRRMAVGVVDDERHCVMPECGVEALAEDWQTTLPDRETDLRAKAQRHREVAAMIDAEADAVRAQIKTSRARPWLCDGHRARLRAADLRGLWGDAGRLVLPRHLRDRTGEVIAATVAAVEANPPSAPEPQPSIPRTIRRLRRVSAKAGV